MRKKRYLFIIIAVFIYTIANVFFAEAQQKGQALGKAAKAAQPAKATGPAEATSQSATKGVKDMTREELVSGITRLFGAYPDLVKVAPGIEAVKDEKGTIKYIATTKDGRKIPLADVDKETLESIFLKVQNEFTRVNTEKTMKQMKEIRRIQELNRQTRSLATRTTQPVGGSTYKPYKPPATAPKTYTPPKIPTIPRR